MAMNIDLCFRCFLFDLFYCCIVISISCSNLNLNFKKFYLEFYFKLYLESFT